MDVTRLEKLRRARGWSQAELARQARLHPSEISRYEAGWWKPTPHARAKIAAALGLPEEALFAPDGTLLEESVNG
jgi:transcriptional regulator with XRE-family HTH domain